jgi:predicted nucleic acid-binding protein
LIVIDASALTGFLLAHPSALDTAVEPLRGAEREPLHAPELIDLETLNALRGVARRHAASADRVTRAVALLAVIPLIRYPHLPLRARVWELRDQLSAYDAAYLALAEVLDDAVLLTADVGLAERAERWLGIDGVQLVE